MLNAKLWSAVLIAATTLATPSFAAGNDAVSRSARAKTYTSVAPSVRYADRSSSCIRAPRVGAYATEPWTNAPPCEPNTVF